MVTRKDVAKLAGVSPATVSYALTPGRPVSEATRARVLAAAAQLGYTPNAMAATLAGGRSRLIAMVIPSAERAVTSSDLEYLVGAANAAKELGYQVILWTMGRSEVAQMSQQGGGGLVAGVLLMEVLLQDERIGYLEEAGIPFALIGRNADPTGLLFADRDFAEVGRLAVAHLVGLGHRRIALLSTPSGPGGGPRSGAVDRAEEGFSAAVQAAGIRGTVFNCGLSVAAGRDALARLRASHPDVTAVISFNEEATFGLYHGALAQGLRIPDDLSVLSTSVTAKHATYFFPALTAISPPAAQIGAAAARALVRGLGETGADPGQLLWAGELIERASTARPRTGDM